MTDTILIEAVAKRLHEASKTYEPGIGMDEWYVGWPAMAEEAIAAVRRWEAENGWRCVPSNAAVSQLARGLWPDSEPTRDDERRAAMAVDSYPQASSRGLRSDVIRAVSQMSMDYREMVSASPPPPGSAEGVNP
ncbi:hypothetical protein ACHMW5_13840 [Azospirillum melinis]|uniref:hypothetical protein n=1 Tax=Azospirillum melinis TaxID=328839 RepID=UPI0037575081